jgi:hypothetical protein
MTAINYSEKFETTVKEIDRVITEKIVEMHDDEFQLPKATLFGFDYIHGELPWCKVIAEDADIYEMLADISNVAKLHEAGFKSFAVSTCGWAAPITDDDDDMDTPPSQHPERVRVRLVTLLHNSRMGSAIHFKGKEEITYDTGNAQGSLKSAIEVFNELVKAMYTATSALQQS